MVGAHGGGGCQSEVTWSAGARVISFDVQLYVAASLERVSAQRTAERPVRRVTTAVGDEVGRLAERLRAHTTHVRLLTCGGCSDKLASPHSRSHRLQHKRTRETQ